MSTNYSETERLVLRELREVELPRLVELLGDWEVARWLAVLPYPYTLQNAEDFYFDMKNAAARGLPEFFALSTKTDNLLIGGIGLHFPRGANPHKGELEIGYWLGRPFWGCGFMIEAARAVVSHGFARASTQALSATTGLDNVASHNVLRKLGLQNLGKSARDYRALRGENTILKWHLPRDKWLSMRSYC